MEELNIKSLINENMIPRVLIIAFPTFDFINNNVVHKETQHLQANLMYCDNDICYYDFNNGEYIYINTRNLINYVEKRNCKSEKLNILGLFLFNKDYNGSIIEKISDDYNKYNSIKMNSFVDSDFKKYLISESNIFFRYLVNICDNEKLKEYLSNQELIDIDNTIEDFYIYTNKYDSESIIQDYIDKYDSAGIIKWFVGLTNTEDLIKNIKETENETQLS